MTPPAPADGTGRTGRPAVTSRAEILAAARQIIDRDGWERLTMRHLAAEVGIGGPTLYRNVRDREDLLIQLVNEHADRTLTMTLSGEPRDRVIAATIAIHDSLATLPWAAEVLTADGLLGRLGPSALRAVDAVLAGAADAGCTPEQAVDVFRSLWYFTVGEILVRAKTEQRWATGGGPVPTRASFDALEPEQMPRLAAVTDEWPELAARDIYPTAVGAFVDGLLAQAASSRR